MSPEGKRLAELSELVSAEVEELVRTLTEDKEHVSMVLRFHLLTENLLERLILVKLAKGERVLKCLRYSKKVELVNALDVLTTNEVGALRKLNSLRNMLSHTREATVGLADVDGIGKEFGKGYSKAKKNEGSDVFKLFVAVSSMLYGRLVEKVICLERPDLLSAGG